MQGSLRHCRLHQARPRAVKLLPPTTWKQHGQTALRTPTSSSPSACACVLSQPGAPWAGMSSSSLACICLQFLFSVFHPFRPRSLIPVFCIVLVSPLLFPRNVSACRSGPTDSLHRGLGGAVRKSSPLSQQQTQVQTERITPLRCGRYQTPADFCLLTACPVPAGFLPSLYTKGCRPRPPPLWAADFSGSTVHTCPEPAPRTLGSRSHPNHLLGEHHAGDTHLLQHPPAPTNHRGQFRPLLGNTTE